VLSKDRGQSVEHLVVARLAWRRGVGGGEQARPEPRQVEALPVREGRLLERRRAEETLQVGLADPLVADGPIVDGAALEQLLVGLHEGRATAAPLVPDQRDPAARPEDAGELAMGR